MFSAMSQKKFPGSLRRALTTAAFTGFFFIALNLLSAPTGFLVDNWGTEKGLPSSTVTSIAQTPDGYLWVGTYNGLARFDGARFVNFDPANKPELTQPRVQGLFLDANGTLWINTFRGGLTSYRNGVFRNEWADRNTFDLHTTLVSSKSNLVTFVTQYGEVLQRDPQDSDAAWTIVRPPMPPPIFQCVDREGKLWFLTRDNHILQFADGKFLQLPDDGGLSGGSYGNKIYAVVADADGQVFAGAENEIARWDGKQFAAITPTNGVADIQPQFIFPMRNGSLWVLDGARFRKMSGRRWEAEISEWRGLLGPASNRAMGAHEDQEGGLWLNHYGNGLFHVAADGKFQRLTSPPDNLPSDRFLPSDRVNVWFQGRDGGLWAGVDHGGLVRLRDRRFQVLSAADGLGARTALSVCEGANGTVWIGTSGGGLTVLTPQPTNNQGAGSKDMKLETYKVGASASANLVFSISPRADGGAWLSAAEGEDLYQFFNGQIQRVSWDVHGIKSILTDHAGRIWMGTKSGIAQWSGELRWVLGANNSADTPSVRALVETPSGEIWAGADNGALYRCDISPPVTNLPNDALSGQPIYSLCADADGALWAGTFRGGLLRFKNGKFFRFSAEHGLPAVIISQLLLDDYGQFWLGTEKGIYRIAKARLDAIADGQKLPFDYVAFGQQDGLASVECSDSYQPACWRGKDGRLWFATVGGGVISVNPRELTPRLKPSPVLIEEMHVDGNEIALKPRVHTRAVSSSAQESDFEPVVLPPGKNQFDFRFTTLSFDAGDRARFRYRLVNNDADWVNADTLRVAHYSKLAPGRYRFHVIACNNEGVWNETGATLDFELKPFFYQTKTFWTLVGLLIVSGVALIARRLATLKYRRKLMRLEQQHAIERDRARIAKDIHDDVGAGLTQITLLTELTRREPDQAAANLERISDSARQLTKAMDEIVWAVDPQHDTFAGLVDYFSAYAEDYLRVADIRFRLDLPTPLPELRVDAELRYNLFLALKEALNNAVKHSHATEVWLRLRVEEKYFTLILEDNGRGLAAGYEAPDDAGRITGGSGLLNMKRRLADVGGTCEISGAAGGTRIAFSAPIKREASPVVAIGRELKGE